MSLNDQRARMAELLAKLRAEKSPAFNPPPAPETIQEVQELEALAEETTTTDKYGNIIQYNANQQRAVDLIGSGKSCIVIGAAGTGKTTSMKGAVTKLIQSGLAGLLSSEGHKHLISQTPGIVVCAYTRRAVANIRKNMPEDMKSNCITIHKLLEYQPVYYDIPDGNGGMKSKMVFEATRHRSNPLPRSIHTIIFEESSMIGTDLYKEVMNACPHRPQVVFLGDIQQLPPVFGPAILGFKLLELPVVELTEVYRQALESPIIRLAHRILANNPIPAEEFKEWHVPGQLKIHPWAKKDFRETALDTIALFFCGNTLKADVPAEKKIPGAILSKVYDPEEDMILLPFNKAFGTDELNKHIANFLARQRKEYTYEIVAGFNKIYLSPGDRILYDKEDATILKIETNPAYAGAMPMVESQTLDYWGYDPVKHTRQEDASEEAIDFMLSQVASSEREDRVHQCSHILTIQMRDSEQEIRISKASEINSLLLGYCLTVHKSQGSEWRKVFFITHQSHATMLQRELIYTAVTRAREELMVICEPEMFIKGIESQRVKGDTIEEKAEFFKGKLDEGFKLELDYAEEDV